MERWPSVRHQEHSRCNLLPLAVLQVTINTPAPKVGHSPTFTFPEPHNDQELQHGEPEASHVSGKSLPVTQSGGRVTKANQEETGRTGCHRSQAGGCGKVEVGAGQGGRKGVHPPHQRRSGNNQAGKPNQRQEERILKIQFLERHWELIKGKRFPSSHKYGIYLQVE